MCTVYKIAEKQLNKMKKMKIAIIPLLPKNHCKYFGRDMEEDNRSGVIVPVVFLRGFIFVLKCIIGALSFDNFTVVHHLRLISE